MSLKRRCLIGIVKKPAGRKYAFVNHPKGINGYEGPEPSPVFIPPKQADGVRDGMQIAFDICPSTDPAHAGKYQTLNIESHDNDEAQARSADTPAGGWDPVVDIELAGETGDADGIVQERTESRR